MNRDPQHLIDKKAMDEAVKASLEINARSSIMFLLRERAIREVIEASLPILIAPLIDRINELEADLGEATGEQEDVEPTTAEEVLPPTHKSDGKLEKLKDALDAMMDVIESEEEA